MRPSELGYFLALWHLDPWGEQRADLRMGILASTLGNIHRDPKRTAPYKPQQFMPYRPTDPRREAAQLSKRLLAAFGLKVDKTKAKKGK